MTEAEQLRVGQRVRMGDRGVSTFVVVDVDGEHPVIEADCGDPAGRYTFSVPSHELRVI